MNRENIRKLIKELEITKTFNQERWAHRCGSPACIGGHAVVLDGWELVSGTHNLCIKDGHPGFIPLIAQRWMGIDSIQADDLFNNFPSQWIIVAKDAVATLEHLLKTGEIEWQMGE